MWLVTLPPPPLSAGVARQNLQCAPVVNYTTERYKIDAEMSGCVQNWKQVSVSLIGNELKTTQS